ncbi:MAG: hypothetical protein II821_04850 [Treponema sp.]|nr:hypothetical protein [Treponema sp.]
MPEDKRKNKIINLLNAIIFIAENENTVESISIKEVAIEISNLIQKDSEEN